MTQPATFVETPDGTFGFLAADDGSVIASGWTADGRALLARIPAAAQRRVGHADATPVREAVEAYYGGELAAIDSVHVDQPGTTFQHDGWAVLRDIPAGAPLTYAAFAAATGKPSAVRAAASICARNAVALFVPCHRVLRSDGSVGQFAWGAEVKRSLLDREATA